MNVVIVGDGKVGYALAEQLSQEGHDLVVIDNKSQALNQAINVLDVICVEGNGASMAVQQEAGVDKADLLIAATSADELNILCCMVAKKLGCRHTISRVRNPEYRDQLRLMKNDLGLSMVINPELAAAAEISRILRFPAAIQVDAFARGTVELVTFRIGKDNPLIGQPLSSLYQKYQLNLLICAVQRGDEVYIPGGDFVLQENDRVSVTGSPSKVSAFFKQIGLTHGRIRSVMIVGGSRIGYYLARQLLDMGIRVTIIEQDPERCDYLNDMLPKATIIQGDGTDEELLKEERLDQTDAFVALTGMDEENIIISMYASRYHLQKVITKINRLTFMDVLIQAGIDSVISPKNITANQIIRYVRAMQNSLGSSNIETLHRMVNNRVEALELRIRQPRPFLDQPLKELRLKKNLLIACILRKGKVIIPHGNDCLMLDDTVIVVTTNVRLDDINDIMR